MRAVVQKVSEANVKVDEKTVGEINKGLLVFLGIGKEDDNKDLKYMINKVLGLRIFEDKNGKMNLSVMDVEGEILIISQFTLYGDVKKGKRPSFTASADPKIAENMYNEFIEECTKRGIKTEQGVFGAHMDVGLKNDGPVTILIDSKKTF